LGGKKATEKEGRVTKQKEDIGETLCELGGGKGERRLKRGRGKRSGQEKSRRSAAGGGRRGKGRLKEIFPLTGGNK